MKQKVRKDRENANAAKGPETVGGALLHPRVKLTLHTQERFFGPGVCELLERIEKTGSIRAASMQMEMSYTKAWKILNRAEDAMGICLITRTNGGRQGGSSVLTEEGKEAVRCFREMEEKLMRESEKLLQDYRRVFGAGD